MTASSLRRSLAAGLVLAGVWTTVAIAQTPPTNLRVSNFVYAAKQHRFTFEWNAAKTAAEAPYPSYQLSAGKGCGYETLNPADKILFQAATWVLYPSGPRLGVTVVCGCPRKVWGYDVGVRALGPSLPALPAKIKAENVPADHRHPTSPTTVLLVCS
ncbi:MAG: hypothetical protein ABI647_13740 [Gemmatimonadota bacterium]